MITAKELKNLQDFIKFTMDDQEYQDLYEDGGDSLVFCEVEGLIENDMSDTGATGLGGFVYKDLLETLSKIQRT